MLSLVSTVRAEGYYCPYESLGYDGVNDIIYDYYSSQDEGATWIRLGEIGWVSRDNYCGEKANPALHFDAGEAKCNDSVGKCVWSEGSCIPNITAEPDCIQLCQAVLNEEGPECLGEGCGSREDFYALCDIISPDPVDPSPSPVYGKCALPL